MIKDLPAIRKLSALLDAAVAGDIGEGFGAIVALGLVAGIENACKSGSISSREINRVCLDYLIVFPAAVVRKFHEVLINSGVLEKQNDGYRYNA